MSLMGFINHPAGVAFACTVCLGITLGARQSIPWSVVTAVSKGSNNAGSNTSLFNLSQAVPGLISALAGSAILTFSSLSSVFIFYAVPTALAAAVVLYMIPVDLERLELELGTPEVKHQAA